MFRLYAIQQNSNYTYSFLKENIDKSLFSLWETNKKNLTNEQAKVQSLLGIYLIDKAKLGKKLCYIENGKPYLEDFDGYISLSHTNGLCVLAISDKNIGVDCENVSKVLDYEKMAKRWFLPNEFAFYNNNPTKENFFSLWTKKEAYSKWTGKGLKDFSNFDVTSLSFKTLQIEDFIISVYLENLDDFQGIYYIS